MTAGETSPTSARVVVTRQIPEPALELLRRDLLARADIQLLNESLVARDKDLELLLSVTGSHPASTGSDDLKSLLANAAGHLKCVLAGIVVPDKGLVITHPGGDDHSILTRTQRQLLAITQTRRDPLVIASLMVRDFERGRDDVSVVVARRPV